MNFGYPLRLDTRLLGRHGFEGMEVEGTRSFSSSHAIRVLFRLVWLEIDGIGFGFCSICQGKPICFSKKTPMGLGCFCLFCLFCQGVETRATYVPNSHSRSVLALRSGKWQAQLSGTTMTVLMLDSTALGARRTAVPGTGVSIGIYKSGKMKRARSYVSCAFGSGICFR